MADAEAKVAENVEGPFFVDENCSDCGQCRDTAPEFFARNQENGYSYVFRQPESDTEVELCVEAMENCPMEAIGNDGDQ